MRSLYTCYTTILLTQNVNNLTTQRQVQNQKRSKKITRTLRNRKRRNQNTISKKINTLLIKFII